MRFINRILLCIILFVVLSKNSYSQIYEYYKKLENLNNYCKYCDAYILAELEKQIVVTPKDEFESAEDYKNRLAELDIKKSRIIAELRNSQLERLNELKREIEVFVESGLFTSTYNVEQKYGSGATHELQTYDIDKKYFPIKIALSTDNFIIPESYGYIFIDNLDRAKTLKTNYSDNKLNFCLGLNYKYNLNESTNEISIVPEQMYLKDISNNIKYPIILKDNLIIRLIESADILKITKRESLVTSGWVGGDNYRLVKSNDDNLFALMVNENPNIEIYDANTGKQLTILRRDYQKNMTGSGGYYWALRLNGIFTFDNQKFVSWNPFNETRNRDSEVTIWDIKSASIISKINLNNSIVVDCDISYDNKYVLLKLYPMLNNEFGSGYKLSTAQIAIYEVSTSKKIFGEIFSKILSDRNIENVKINFSVSGRYILFTSNSESEPSFKIGYDFQTKEYTSNYNSYLTDMITHKDRISYSHSDNFEYSLTNNYTNLVIKKKYNFPKLFQRLNYILKTTPIIISSNDALQLIDKWKIDSKYSFIIPETNYAVLLDFDNDLVRELCFINYFKELNIYEYEIGNLVYRDSNVDKMRLYESIDSLNRVLYSNILDAHRTLNMLEYSRLKKDFTKVSIPLELNKVWENTSSIFNNDGRSKIFVNIPSYRLVDIICDNSFKIFNYDNGFLDITSSIKSPISELILGEWESNKDNIGYNYNVKFKCNGNELVASTSIKKGNKLVGKTLESKAEYNFVSSGIAFKFNVGFFSGNIINNEIVGKLSVSNTTNEHLVFKHK